MRIAVVCILLLFTACNGNKIPKDVLPQNKMQIIMWDLMQADELAVYKKAQDSSFRLFDSTKAWYSIIYQNHKTSEDEFKKSMHFYEAHPDLLQVIIDSLQKKSQQPAIPLTKDLH